MRITNSSRGHHTNLTKCYMMKEENPIHGMNGVSDSGNAAAPTSDDQHPQNSEAYNLEGGRLKFFKNGRFILELARAREGEKVAWVPVPKKTFWPPQGSASSVSTYRQESSTSLSVSDDNSSVQSSPWQRDHTWKQSTPLRHAASNLTFYFARKRFKRPLEEAKPKTAPICWLYHLQRCPYTATLTLQCCQQKKCNNSAIIKPARVPRLPLNQIVQVLWNKSLQALNNITSPRKRILRELERVTIDDLSVNKRCRGKVNQQQHTPPKIANDHTPVASVKIECNGLLDNHVEERKSVVVSVSATSSVAAAAAKNCSYSITSLLGGKVDGRDDKLSSQFLPAPRIAPHHHHSVTVATPDEITGQYAPQPQDTVDSPARTSDLLINKRSPLTVTGSPSLPGSPAEHYPPSHYAPPPPPAPYVSPYTVYPSLGHPHHPHSGYITPYYNAAAYAAARASPPGYYPTLAHPTHPHAHPAAPPLPRHDQSPYSWAAVSAAVSYEHGLHRDDTISDVPLNLSKHAD